MKLIKQFENVRDFEVNDTSFCFYTGHFKSGEYNFLQLNDWERITKYEAEYFFLTSDENYFYIQTDNPGTIEVFSNDGIHYKSINGRHNFFLSNTFNSCAYFISESRSGKCLTQLSLIDFNLEYFKIPGVVFKLIVSDTSFVYRLGTVLYNYNFKEDKIIWSTDLGNVISSEIYLNKNILMVSTKHEFTFGVDLDTGNVKWKLTQSYTYFKQDSKSGLFYGFAANQLGGNRYLVLDSEKGEFKISKMFDNFHYDVNSKNAVIDSERLYFLSGPLKEGYDKQALFGAIDITRGEIVLNQKLECKNGVKAIMIKLNNKYLFILDSNQTLHIYDKHS